MKRSIGAGEWIRRGLGAAVLAAIVAIALGLDTGFLTNVSVASTTSLEQGLLDRLQSAPKPPRRCRPIDDDAASRPAGELPVEGPCRRWTAPSNG